MDPRKRRVSEIMQTEIATLKPGERLDLADDLMKLGRVRHMPVVEGNRLVGIVSSRDLLAASLSKVMEFDPTSRRSFLRSVEVSEAMTRNVVSVPPDATLALAAERLVKHRIGCLPVVQADGTLIGLVTETDLLSAALLRASEPVIEVEGEETEESGSFADWMRGELDDLRRVRDELRVRAHLAKSELRDQWEALEKQLQSLEGRVRQASHAAEEPLQELRADARKLLDDLREGFRRIRQGL